jgi:hypothetical protein
MGSLYRDWSGDSVIGNHRRELGTSTLAYAKKYLHLQIQDGAHR